MPGLRALCWTHGLALFLVESVNALSGLYLISTVITAVLFGVTSSVSMPSRAYTSFLQIMYLVVGLLHSWRCQCPLGLIPHFYVFHRADFYSTTLTCQCPLGLIPHFYQIILLGIRRITLMMCQCPLGLIPHFYTKSFRKDLMAKVQCVNALSGLYLISMVPLQKPRFYAVSRACFCRYLSEYSDNSRFSCMLTFWTYLMRCTYP